MEENEKTAAPINWWAVSAVFFAVVACWFGVLAISRGQSHSDYCQGVIDQYVGEREAIDKAVREFSKYCAWSIQNVDKLQRCVNEENSPSTTGAAD